MLKCVSWRYVCNTVHVLPSILQVMWKRLYTAQSAMYTATIGLASAPAVFQRVLDQILQGMEHVSCYFILITGITDKEHLANLAEVLHRLHKHSAWLKLEKCRFLQDSVEYLGHRIDAHGLHTTDSKLKAITEAPQPTNVQELCTFLGL